MSEKRRVAWFYLSKNETWAKCPICNIWVKINKKPKEIKPLYKTYCKNHHEIIIEKVYFARKNMKYPGKKSVKYSIENSHIL